MRQKKILIVDDDPDIHQLYHAYLQRAGYDVGSARDGISGVAAARRSHPDLVVLDLGLPAGDGEVALRTLRSIEGLMHVPVLVVSARPQEEWAERLGGFGANGYLEKPVDPARLVTCIQELLGEGPASAPPAGALPRQPQHQAQQPQVHQQPAQPAASHPHAPPVPAVASTGLSCPHCGGALASLHAIFPPETLAALAQALRQQV